jgi:hypothetical protein
MEKLNFTELHKEKLDFIFENIEALSNMKENDTTIPPWFFNKITRDAIADYDMKMDILNKNTKFVANELQKDFKLLRKQQRRSRKKIRKQRAKEIILYIFPLCLITDS